MTTAGKVVAALVHAYDLEDVLAYGGFADLQASESQPVTLLELLELLADAGIEGAAEHANAERVALTRKTMVRAAMGDLITFEDALRSAPNRRARKAVEARGQCDARHVETEGTIARLGLRCVLPGGHSTAGLKGNERHAAPVDGEHKDRATWLRW